MKQDWRYPEVGSAVDPDPDSMVSLDPYLDPDGKK
jgi:hypothetical protein